MIFCEILLKKWLKLYLVLLSSFVKYLIDNYNLLKIDPRSTIKYCFGLEFATGTNSRFKTKELLDGALLEGKKLRSISFVVGLPK